jgi:hypothetical protein
MNTQSNVITTISTLIAGVILSAYGLMFVVNAVIGN